MKRICLFTFFLSLCVFQAFAEENSITIYTQNFAVVRQPLHLSLKAGINDVSFSDTTAHVEPDSVMLLDPRGERLIKILEQNYRSDPISQGLLLNLNEGEVLDFLTTVDGKEKIVKGRVIRSGYVIHQAGLRRYGSQYAQTQISYAYSSGAQQPLIEVDGQLRFQLPGIPLFPSLDEDSILKPTFNWVLESDMPGPVDAELSYVTGGMGWDAMYNMVSSEEGDEMELIGWITLDNQSGKTFEDTHVKLVAGDVSRLRDSSVNDQRFESEYIQSLSQTSLGVSVSEKDFSDYHLYTLPRAMTIRDRETKQVELVRASGIHSKKVYVYDGVKIDSSRYRSWSDDALRSENSFGIESNPKVWIMQEFMNSSDNKLGVALPKGQFRFYRRDSDGQLEFSGENIIDHTPKDELVRLYTGNAFDIVGQRKRSNYIISQRDDWLDESFEITLRNHKSETVEVRVVEHLYRGKNWMITELSDPYSKADSQTIEFPVKIKPGEARKLTYTVHYTW